MKQAELGTDFRIRISWYADTNRLRFFVNDQEIGSTVTTMEPRFIFAAEASAAHDGDQINATIKDVRVKVGDDASDYGVIGVWNDNNDYFGLDGTVTNWGEVVADGPYSTGGNRNYGVDIAFSGTANIPGVNPANGLPWDWDTCFSAIEPTTGTKEHPLSAVVNIAQRR